MMMTSAAIAALTSAAAARDLPATPEGAAKITSFLSTYIGKPAPGAPPTFSVTPEGADYLVSADIAALSAPLNNAGVRYDSATVKYKAFEQDDGAWRVEQNELPVITGHSKQGDVIVDTTIAVNGFKSVFTIDPAISWIRSAQFSIDSAAIRATAPGLNEAFDLAAQQGEVTTTSSPEGVASTFKQNMKSADMRFSMDPKAANPDANPDAKPVNFAAKATAPVIAIKLDGVKPRPLLDLWAFLVAHPSRPELAADEAALKTLLSAALPARTTVTEDVGSQGLSLQIPQGVVEFGEPKFGFSIAAGGPASRFEPHFSAVHIALPPGLVAAAYQDLVPTSFDLDLEFSGFDLTAATEEAIADMHLAGDGPVISKEDDTKISARLVGVAPLVVDIPTSHIRAPQLDLTFQGQIRYIGSKPTGTVTLHMLDFDKTVAALKGLGPEAERKMVPFFAMAKGLAKADPGGVLTWVGEIGADGVMKVNGLPLGKAPF